jgi:hypothetical protein
MTIRTAVIAIAIALAPGLALAQGATQRGAADGAAAGGQIGGPIGAAVGGTGGAAVGAAVDIPAAVIGTITGTPHPSVVVQEEVVVGRPLPRHVELYPVPQYRQYRYAVVNNHRVIVDPGTRRVLRIID